MENADIDKILSAAGWRETYVNEAGEREFAGAEPFAEAPNFDDIRRLLHMACDAEREACAAACEAEAILWMREGQRDVRDFSLCAARIRARSNAPHERAAEGGPLMRLFDHNTTRLRNETALHLPRELR